MTKATWALAALTTALLISLWCRSIFTTDGKSESLPLIPTHEIGTQYEVEEDSTTDDPPQPDLPLGSGKEGTAQLPTPELRENEDPKISPPSASSDERRGTTHMASRQSVSNDIRPRPFGSRWK